MTEGLKSEALFLKSIFLRKSLRVAVTATHLPLQGRLFSAKRRTKSSSLSAIFALYRKKVPGKIPIPFLSVGYEKDVFPFLQERVELSSDLHLQMIFSVMI